MSESERVACKACGKWMFHLAKTCPHCGAPQEAKQAAPAAKVEATVKPKVELKLSPEEARSLLAATPTGGSGVSFTDVALEIIWPRVGALELALSIVAGPVTSVTVLVLGYLLLREKRGRRDDKLQGVRQLAVPACTALVAATLYGGPVPWLAWGLLAVSFLAWVAREVLRSRGRHDPLL